VGVTAHEGGKDELERPIPMNIYEYPKSITLKDGTELKIRPLRKEDEKALHDYFLRLSQEDRIRLKDDVTDPKVIENWIYNLDYDVILPLIALDNGRIAANATLHFNPIGWTKHQAEVRITSDPEYREKGLATLLVENLIDLAVDLGLEQVTAEIVPALDKARSLFEKLGFREVGVLKDFIKDLKGNYADLVLMVRDIRW
jgi:L-amino acid N-acyltransferase YncA